MRRREFAVLAVSAAVLTALSTLPGCKKDARCKRCGMKLDRESPWRAELVAEDGSVVAFDTPRCALTSWRSGETHAKTIRVVEYYDRVPKDGADVRFVVGGDVLGPMGPDFVPVDPPRVTKFIQDHAGERSLRLEEIDEAFLRAN